MTAKPTTITAAEFIDNGYAARIAARECVVKSILYTKFEVVSVEQIKPNSDGWDVAITDTKSTYRTWSNAKLTVTWLTQPADAQPDSGATGGGNAQVEAGDVSDAVALARAQIARLRSALETIRDYPVVEVDMELGHQVAGMAMQAEVALEEVPSGSGLLTILANKLSAAQAELASAKAEAGRLRAALEPFANTWDRYVTTGSKMIGLRNEPLDFDKWFWLTKEHERAARDYAEAAAALQAGTGGG